MTTRHLHARKYRRTHFQLRNVKSKQKIFRLSVIRGAVFVRISSFNHTRLMEGV